MANGKKAKDKVGSGMSRWFEIVIPILLSAILGAQFMVVYHLAGIEERTKNIDDMESGIEVLLDRGGAAKVTPTDGGTLITYNVEIKVPPNSVSEPTIFTVKKILSSNLPASLDKDYVYSDGFTWSTGGKILDSQASIAWGLKTGIGCIDAKIFHWNNVDRRWKEVSPEYCHEPTDVVGFNAKDGGYYVLAKEK